MATLLLLFASHVLGYSLPGAPLRAAGAATHNVAIYMQMGVRPSGSPPISGPQRAGKPMPEKRSAAAEVLEEARNEEEEAFDAALQAAAELARTPAAIEAKRAAGMAAAAALQAKLDAGDTALAKAVASKGTSTPTGKLAKALKKPKGTVALIGEGVKLDCISLGGYDLNDASYVSGQFRNGGCSAVSVLLDPEEGLGEDALVATVSEQQTARGEFPSPIPVFVRGPLVDELQLAAAAAGGAHGVVVPLALNGAEKTGALLEAAAAYGLEAIVRVCSAEELSTALLLSPAPMMIMFGDCTVQGAAELRDTLPEGVLSVADVPFMDVRGAWKMRDLEFDALLGGKPLMEVCVRDRVPPTAVITSILSKGSVKFGLGVKKGRLEGAKEYLGSLAM